jgi:hypothetical protein
MGNDARNKMMQEKEIPEGEREAEKKRCGTQFCQRRDDAKKGYTVGGGSSGECLEWALQHR